MALTKKQVTKQALSILTKDFETNSSDYSASLKRQCDRLANFAYIAMKHLEDNNIQDFVLLKHDDLRSWWDQHKAAMRKDQLLKEAKARKAEIKQRALARLTDEEKEALGLKKK